MVYKIYGVFGHGVESASMTWMFLYPLIGGMVFFFVVRTLFPKVNYLNGYRVFYNLHNSGIALLTFGSMAKGIFEIAGTASDYTKIFFIVGWGFVSIGITILIILKLSPQKTN